MIRRTLSSMSASEPAVSLSRMKMPTRDALEDGVGEAALASEVVVEQRLVHAGFVGDVLHARARGASADEHGVCRVENALLGVRVGLLPSRFFFCRPVGLTILFDHLVNTVYSDPSAERKNCVIRCERSVPLVILMRAKRPACHPMRAKRASDRSAPRRCSRATTPAEAPANARPDAAPRECRSRRDGGARSPGALQSVPARRHPARACHEPAAAH